MTAFERNLWVLVKPADDVPGQWTGHCLDLDIVSAGTSLAHAIAMTAEAVCECVADDLSHDRFPLDRRPAPPEFYAELSRVQRDGEYGDANDLPVDSPVIAAVQFKIRMQRLQPVERQRLIPGDGCFEQLPPAWLMAMSNAPVATWPRKGRAGEFDPARDDGILGAFDEARAQLGKEGFRPRASDWLKELDE